MSSLGSKLRIVYLRSFSKSLLTLFCEGGLAGVESISIFYFLTYIFTNFLTIYKVRKKSLKNSLYFFLNKSYVSIREKMREKFISLNDAKSSSYMFFEF